MKSQNQNRHLNLNTLMKYHFCESPKMESEKNSSAEKKWFDGLTFHEYFLAASYCSVEDWKNIS